jgi:hypothetical protein
MSYYPPEGKEKKALERLRPLVSRMSKNGETVELYSHFGATIYMGHALEGVRCNGRERVTSIQDIFEEMDCWPRRIKLIRREVQQLERTLAKMDKIRAGFVKCHSCHGKKGRKTKPPPSHHSGPWEDCARCLGRGVLERPRLAKVER